MSQPDALGLGGEMAQAQVKAIIENAQRLGLIWTLRMATVTSDDPVMAVYDGDTDGVAIAMTSMVGVPLVGQRVYVIGVPPAGNFIVGSTVPYRARRTLDQASSTVTFSDIPSSLRTLRVSYMARSDNAVQVQYLLARVNGNAGAVYSVELLQGQNATATAGPSAGATSALCGAMTGASATGGIYGSGWVEFNSWDLGAAGFASLGLTFRGQALGVGVGNFYTVHGGGVYGVVGPYTSVSLLPQAGNFIAGSDFQLYGE